MFEITYMCKSDPILLISNYTRAIFVASLDRRRWWRHFDFDFSRQCHISLRNFFSISSLFELEFAPNISSSPFPWNQLAFWGLSRKTTRRLKTFKMFVSRHKSRSFFFEFHKQMTSDDLCPAANTRMYKVQWSF